MHCKLLCFTHKRTNYETRKKEGLRMIADFLKTTSSPAEPFVSYGCTLNFSCRQRQFYVCTGGIEIGCW